MDGQLPSLGSEDGLLELAPLPPFEVPAQKHSKVSDSMNFVGKLQCEKDLKEYSSI